MPVSLKPNKLLYEKSPYLLQHAYNPVNWYPWSQEAFNKAKECDRPIFLSIGYSTCHWCHVMERESFEDTDVSQLLNQFYVSVKVDREERPDIDQIYMTVCQALTGQGGWPLTIVMTPDMKPFFAGTYLPKNDKWGRRGLIPILEEIIRRWNSDREMLMHAGEQISEAIAQRVESASGEMKDQVTKALYQTLEDNYDASFGGFGKAPKFPTPHKIMFLLRYWKRTKVAKALEMAEKTLSSMYAGGIYDHIGFGFSRYSTDRQWLVPHFEKMLYDNALISAAAVEIYQVTGKGLYLRMAEEIYRYILRDMTSPEGAFYTAEDADSEGVEGKYYVWEPREVEEVLGVEDGKLFCEIYDITKEGNFEGKNIPNLIASGVRNHADPKLERFRDKLFQYRERRIHPNKDDKVLTSWNGMMIASLAKAAGITGNSEYLEAAKRAESFIWSKLRNKDGRLLARYRDGESSFLGYLDDYAFLQWGLLELYNTTLEPKYLKKSLYLLDQMKELFWDGSGFYFYGKDGEKLIARPKEVYDGAVPSGNSIAAYNIIRLARITGRDDLMELFQKQMNAFAQIVMEHPIGYAFFITAFLTGSVPHGEIVICGNADSSEVKAMAIAVRQKFLPESVLLFRPCSDKVAEIDGLSSLVEGRTSNGKLPAVAYICQDYTCQPPVTTVEDLVAKLQEL